MGFFHRANSHDHRPEIKFSADLAKKVDVLKKYKLFRLLAGPSTPTPPASPAPRPPAAPPSPPSSASGSSLWTPEVLRYPPTASPPLLCAASNAGTSASARTSSACASASCAHVIASPSSALGATSSLAPPCEAAPSPAPTPPTSFTRVRCATPRGSERAEDVAGASAILASPLSHRRVAEMHRLVVLHELRHAVLGCGEDADAFERVQGQRAHAVDAARLVVPEVPSAAAGVSSPSPSSSSATAMATSLPTTPSGPCAYPRPDPPAARPSRRSLSFVARPNPFPVRSTSPITLRHASEVPGHRHLGGEGRERGAALRRG